MGEIATAAVYVPRLNGMEEEVLMIEYGPKSNHASGLYGLPGGKQEAGESLMQTAVRELKEESGLIAKINDLRLVDFDCYAVMRSKRYWMRIFTCEKYEGEIKSEDLLKTKPFWMPVACVLELDKLGKLEVNIGQAVRAGYSKVSSERLKMYRGLRT